VTVEKKCAFCSGAVAYEPYYENINGKKLAFHAKACAEAYKIKQAEKAMTKCAFCGGAVAFAPYYETIGGKKMAFHAKACAEAMKTKK
jgi:flavoprotein